MRSNGNTGSIRASSFSVANAFEFLTEEYEIGALEPLQRRCPGPLRAYNLQHAPRKVPWLETWAQEHLHGGGFTSGDLHYRLHLCGLSGLTRLKVLCDAGIPHGTAMAATHLAP